MADANQAILIRFKDTGAVAQSQGGKTAGLFSALFPSTIASEVYSRALPEVKKSLSDKGIEADVSLVDPKNFGAAGGASLGSDIGFAIGGAALVGLAWFFVSRRGRK